ncbi:hypothetical protein Taro_028880 [Colocasia esculenta]|uniref:Uncharacterized protein n=1 Tax=Colocasia esculenta TaxID=4460 RepID=A0A843VRN3_COLES|nr:hypothetical protein [Colocasia esculenta]
MPIWCGQWWQQDLMALYLRMDADLVVRFCKDVETRSQTIGQTPLESGGSVDPTRLGRDQLGPTQPPDPTLPFMLQLLHLLC